jgi:anaerobic selenocysteine-containing dehydrogenase
MGEAKPNTEIFRLLAARMGLDDACFADTDDDIAAQAFDKADPRAAHFDWEELKQRGWSKLAIPDAPYAEGGFPTPSGKCEFYSARMLADGLDPLPAYIPPYESVASNPELARRYPLAMISPPARNFLNSTFVNVQSLRDTEGEPHLEMHPHDAAARGIASGDRVRIRNDRGAFTAKARVTADTRQGLVVGLSIWWKKLAADGRNANEVTSQRRDQRNAALHPIEDDRIDAVHAASGQRQHRRQRRFGRPRAHGDYIGAHGVADRVRHRLRQGWNRRGAHASERRDEPNQQPRRPSLRSDPGRIPRQHR